MNDGTLRASEIGQFRFCERAWWYARSGVRSANTQLLEAGSKVHRAHVRTVRRWAIVQRLGLGVMIAGMVLIVLQFAASQL